MVKLTLRPLMEEDVTQKYIDWFKQEPVVEFSNNKDKIFTIKGQKDYIHRINASDDEEIYGIFLNKTNHIGNINIQKINLENKTAEIAYVIGDINEWGKGYASQAIKEICLIAREKLGILFLLAGCASNNNASKRALEKNNFTLQNIEENKLEFSNKIMDQYNYKLSLYKYTEDIVKVFKNMFNVEFDTKFYDIDIREIETWDSFLHINLLVAIEENLSIEFDQNEIENSFHLLDLIKIAEKKV